MKLGQNESTIDRVIRVIAGLALVALAVAGIVAAPWTYALWAVAAILLITGAQLRIPGIASLKPNDPSLLVHKYAGWAMTVS